ncbi:hypothetical protein QML40_10855, partial [Aerococcus urinaeequi]
DFQTKEAAIRAAGQLLVDNGHVDSSYVKFSLMQKMLMTVAFLFMISGLLGVTIMRANVNAASQQLQEVQQNAEAVLS